MQHEDKTTLPIGVIRFLSWISLALILGCNIMLSALITNQAMEIMLEKQKSFALLLAENVDSQVSRRYTVPLVLGTRSLAFIDNPSPFEPLDQVLTSALQGANTKSIRIFAYNSAVSYSDLPSEIGKKNLASPSVALARSSEEPQFELISSIPEWRSLFSISPEPGTYMLRVAYPLNTLNRMYSFEGEGYKLDILEFSQDITEDYQAMIRFQWSILGMAVISSLILFSLLQLFIRRTEKVLSERVREKERLERELHQHEKLASMGRVVSSIAHEIRNPLGIIRSSAELVLRRQQKENADNPNTALVEAIHDEACRLSGTITDFLDYARPKMLTPQSVDLTVLIEQALVFLGNSLAEQNINIIKKLPEKTLVTGDKDLLYRAIYNILANSAQAVNRDGTIVISAEPADDEVILDIADSGPGFSQDALERALDPFFTTKDGGTGLGLAIVQSIIISHNGTIKLSNVTDGGARVIITLPSHASDS